MANISSEISEWDLKSTVHFCHLPSQMSIISRLTSNLIKTCWRKSHKMISYHAKFKLLIINILLWQEEIHFPPVWFRELQKESEKTEKLDKTMYSKGVFLPNFELPKPSSYLFWHWEVKMSNSCWWHFVEMFCLPTLSPDARLEHQYWTILHILLTSVMTNTEC